LSSSRKPNVDSRVAREALGLIYLLRHEEHKMGKNEIDFVRKMRKKILNYGDAAFISINQISWMRAIAEKYVRGHDAMSTESAIADKGPHTPESTLR